MSRARRNDAERDAAQVRRMLRPLREAEPPELTPARAEAVWTMIRSTRRPARPPRQIWLGALAAVGVAAALTLIVLPESGPMPAPPSATGARVTGATILPSGAHVTVHGGAITLAEATAERTRLVLEKGSVRSEVPKLKPGGRYVVETPLAQVSVRGTRFTVTLTAAGETRVDVEAGVVEVAPRDDRPTVRVRAGERHIVGARRATEAGARAAVASGDWRRAVDLWRSVAAEAADPVSRANALVRAGRLLSRHAPEEAAEHWQALAGSPGAELHAEEIAWRRARALHDAGRLGDARRAAQDFRARFPKSSYARQTRDW